MNKMVRKVDVEAMQKRQNMVSKNRQRYNNIRRNRSTKKINVVTISQDNLHSISEASIIDQKAIKKSIVADGNSSQFGKWPKME
mmetsp:Transcript_4964/g.4215  ORF Transcript_4964/g.4215 Transcript_4964/m.4215 type:complete len:84 (+) Transcript_4964:655-906(+)